jgi:protein-disulfide isomerase
MKKQWIGFLVAMSCWLIVGQAAYAQQAERDQHKIGKINELIQENPEIIPDLLLSLERYVESKEARKNADENHREWLFQNDTLHPWYGSSNPDLTILVYTDYDCPYCKRIEPHLQRIVDEFKNVKVINIILPLRQQQTKDSAVNPSEFAMNVWRNQSDKYPEVAKMLYAKNGLHNAKSIEHVARVTGTRAQLTNASQARAAIMRSYQAFSDYGYSGTPTMIVGSSVIPGFVEYEQLKAVVKDNL